MWKICSCGKSVLNLLVEESIQLSPRLLHFVNHSTYCVYCGTKIKSLCKQNSDKKQKEGDHVIQVIQDKKPIFHNMSHIRIPACGTCNSTRQNNGILAFAQMKGITFSDEVLEILDFVRKNIQIYVLDENLWDKIVRHVTRFLESLVDLIDKLTLIKNIVVQM